MATFTSTRPGTHCAAIDALKHWWPVWARARFDSCESNSASEHDVFFRPGMHLPAMRAGHLVTFDFCLSPQFFPDGLTAGCELGGGRTADEKTFDDRACLCFRCGGEGTKVYIFCWLAETINDARFIDIVKR